MKALVSGQMAMSSANTTVHGQPKRRPWALPPPFLFPLHELPAGRGGLFHALGLAMGGAVRLLRCFGEGEASGHVPSWPWRAGMAWTMAQVEGAQ